MWRVEPLAPAHFAQLELHRAQAYLQPDCSPQLARDLLTLGCGFAAVDGGATIAAAGVMRPHEEFENPVAWALVTSRLEQYRLQFASSIRRFLATRAWPVLDTTIDPHFPAHQRWATWLGFVRLGPFPVVRADGTIVDHWRRVDYRGH